MGRAFFRVQGCCSVSESILYLGSPYLGELASSAAAKWWGSQSIWAYGRFAWFAFGGVRTSSIGVVWC